MVIFTFVLITLILLGILVAGIYFKIKTCIGVSIIALLILAFVGCKTIIKSQEDEIIKLQDVITYLKDENVPMQFKIIKESDEKKEIELSFFDLENKNLGKHIIKLEGKEIYFDFRVIKLDEKNYMFFPYVVYTNKIAPAQGINIVELYNNHGYPNIYNKIEKIIDNKKIDKKLLAQYKQKITTEYGYIRADKLELVEEQFGNAVHDYNMKGITKFKKGITYKIICHPHSGSIEIQKK